MKFIRVLKAEEFEKENENITAKNNLKDLSSKISLAINEFMEQNFNPFEADNYEDAIDFCKTLQKSPSYYMQDNFDNLLNKKIINKNIIKNLGKRKITEMINNALKYYGKDALKDVKENRDSFEDFHDEEDDW